MLQQIIRRLRSKLGRKPSLIGTIVLVALIALSQFLDGDGGLIGNNSPSSGGGGLEASGRARLVDGDSLFIGAREVRMVGIDAPEGPQLCRKGGRDWRCGDAARDALQTMIGGRPIVCRGEKEDQHGRLLGTCEVDGMNLNRELVLRGHVLSYGRYRAEERQAKAAGAGLWASDVEFQTPKAWRRANGVGG